MTMLIPDWLEKKDFIADLNEIGLAVLNSILKAVQSLSVTTHILQLEFPFIALTLTASDKPSPYSLKAILSSTAELK